MVDEQGRDVPLVMGSYGIGLERIAAAAVEEHHDDNGIRWPITIAPFEVAVLALQTHDAEVAQAAESLYASLQARGIPALLDHRDERPGVKLKEADLIGIPVRIAVGKRGLATGQLDLKVRGDREAKTVPPADAAAEIASLVERLRVAAAG